MRKEINCATGEVTEHEDAPITPQAAPTYQELRRVDYPSIPDQLDLLYHGGLVGWKEAIDVVKTKYPKGT